MLDGMTEQLVRITIDGKAIDVAPENTVIQGLALSGEPLSENVGCMGQGVCGSCRCMVRRAGSREVTTELACETLVACPRLPAISATFGSHVVPCDSVEHYASLFRVLAENPAQFQSTRSAGRDFVASNFGWPRTLQPLIDFLEGGGPS